MCDVADEKAVAATVAKLTALCPDGIYALVNNAAVMSMDVAEGLSNEEYDRILGVNVVGTHGFIRGCLPMLRRYHQAGKGRARILNVSSLSAVLPTPLCSAYASSKAALDMYTACIASELSPLGVDIAILSPGPVETDMLDLARSGDPTKVLQNADKAALGIYGDFVKSTVKLSAKSTTDLMVPVATAAERYCFALQVHDKDYRCRYQVNLLGSFLAFMSNIVPTEALAFATAMSVKWVK